MTETGTMFGLFKQVERERDLARDVAMRLEAENEALRFVLSSLGWKAEDVG